MNVCFEGCLVRCDAACTSWARFFHDLVLIQAESGQVRPAWISSLNLRLEFFSENVNGAFQIH